MAYVVPIRAVKTFHKTRAYHGSSIFFHVLLDSCLTWGSTLLHQVLCERDSRIRLNSVLNGDDTKNASFGLLEVFYDGAWGTVCQSSLLPHPTSDRCGLVCAGPRPPSATHTHMYLHSKGERDPPL